MRYPLATLAFLLLLTIPSSDADARGGDAMPPAPPVPAPPRTSAPPRTRAVTFEHWVFWYLHDCGALEARTASARRILPEGTTAGLHDEILARLRPMLRERAIHPDQAGHACLALGKITDREGDIARLESRLDPAARLDLLVRERAALALGLLRRSDPSRQFGAARLDRVRRLLRDTFQREGEPSRTRGMAALALALLADQPTEEKPGSQREWLFERLRDRTSNQDLPVALLMAVGAEPRGSLDEGQVAILRDAALKGRLHEDEISDLLQTYAVPAFARTGGEAALPDLLTLLRARRRVSYGVQRSAALALRDLAPGLDADRRRSVAKEVERLHAVHRDVSTRCFLLIARGACLAAEDDPSFLLARAARASWLERPYALLALGDWLGREGPRGRQAQRTREALRDALKGGLGEEHRAPAAVALGLARDAATRPHLRDLARTSRLPGDARGYALLALALSQPDVETERFVRARIGETTQFEHRLLATRALGIAARSGEAQTTAVLLGVFDAARSGALTFEAARALGRVGTPQAVQALLAIADDPSAQDLARARAVAGLGIAADPEPVPSLARLTDGINYRASTDLVNELLGYP